VNGAPMLIRRIDGSTTVRSVDHPPPSVCASNTVADVRRNINCYFFLYIKYAVDLRNSQVPQLCFCTFCSIADTYPFSSECEMAPLVTATANVVVSRCQQLCGVTVGVTHCVVCSWLRLRVQESMRVSLPTFL
jgi:hypothetical protein